MRQITCPALDAEAVYDDVSAKRRPPAVRERLADAKPRITNAYDTYEQAREDVATLAPAATDPATSADLEGNYRYITNSKSVVRPTILQNNPSGRCPLCGQGRVSTLDHYLPCSEFPEFAILPINLIPACHDCNYRKRAAYADTDGTALFLHAYFDDIPVDERFLFADVEVSAVGPTATFDVKPPESVSRRLARRIRTHFEALGLAEYYLFEATTEIGERRPVLEQMIRDGAGQDDVHEYLRREANGVATTSGTNSWRYALLEGLASSGDVCAGIWIATST